MSYENVISGTNQLCVGTWTLSNTALFFTTVCVYGLPQNVGVSQTFTATYNLTTGILTNGTWVNNTSGTDSGTFTLTEVH
ncbi:hypothetical protein BH11BAC4_BH11BAC4_25950 [soil metagenome]